MPKEYKTWQRDSPGVEDKVEEMDTSAKENVKSKNIQAQNILKIWNLKKRFAL